MTQKNPYLINNKLPEAATISYYNPETDQNLTSEQWNKLNSLNCNEEIIFSQNRIYISEKAYNKGIAMYGPGFWDELGEGLLEVGKFTVRTGAVIGAGAAIVSTGGLAAPLIGAGVYAGGKIVKEIAKDCDNEFFENVGDFVEDVGIDGLTGGLFGLGSSTTRSLAAREMARNGGRLTNGAKVFFTANKVIRIGDKVVNIYGKSKEGMEYQIRAFHGVHKGKGISYDSNCPLCNGEFDRLP